MHVSVFYQKLCSDVKKEDKIRLGSTFKIQLILSLQQSDVMAYVLFLCGVETV